MMGTTKTYLDDFQSILPVALPSIVIIKTNGWLHYQYVSYLPPLCFSPYSLGEETASGL